MLEVRTHQLMFAVCQWGPVQGGGGEFWHIGGAQEIYVG